MWEWQGYVVRTDASIDENSRLVYAVAEVDKPFARAADSERPPLSPGLFVEATISGRPVPGVALLPRSALRSDGGVMVVGEDQRVAVQAVEVLQSDVDRVWVQGLRAGERVVVHAATLLLTGMEVTVRTVTEAPR
jgi:hypothetical protein